MLSYKIEGGIRCQENQNLGQRLPGLNLTPSRRFLCAHVIQGGGVICQEILLRAESAIRTQDV